MEIKIYAPVDCEVKNIESCQDETFAEKIMGNGLLIIPKQQTFVCPFDSGTVKMVFDTKHAYGLEIIPDLNVLIHCGIDTVNLKGVPFNSHVNVNDQVKKDDKLFDVDLNYLKENNVLNETPIIFENSEKFDWEKIDLQQGNFHQGDLIATVHFSEKGKVQQTNNNDLNSEQISQANLGASSQDVVEYFKGSSSKWEKLAIDINEFVGSKANYSSFYNCMTRLRFEIINKDLVKVGEIKKNPNVKGVVWAGNQLQIIIGQEVYKLREAVFELNNNQKLTVDKAKGKSPFKRFLSMFVGIMLPTIPAAVAVGIVQALIALIILISGQKDFAYKFPIWDNEFLKDPEKFKAFFDELYKIITLGKPVDVLFLILSVTGKTFSLFFGVIIAVSAARYFKLNTLMGITIGITICSPLLWLLGGFLGLGGEWTLFNYFKVDPAIGEKNPLLFTILDRMSKYIIQPMNFKMFAIIATIYFAKKVDDFVTPYINPMFQLTIKSFIVFFVPVMVGMFVFLPIWNWIEGIFGIILFGFSKIPFGIGLGFIAAFWEVAVLSGLHIALFMIFAIEQAINGMSGGGGYGMFIPITSLAVWAQVGALIGVIIVTKDSKLRAKALECVPGGFLGITEPILFGINLPKRRPFLLGLVGAFVAGAMAGALNVTGRNGTGLGLFEIFGFFTNPPLDPNGEIGEQAGQLSSVQNGLRYLMCVGAAIVIPLILAMFFYKERQSETSAIKHINRNVVKLINKVDLSDEEKLQLKTTIKELNNVLTKEEVEQFKKLEKNIYKIVQLKTKLEKTNLKAAKENERWIARGRKYVDKNKLDKAQFCKDKIENSRYKERIANLEQKLDQANKDFDSSKVEAIITIKLQVIDQTYNLINIFDQDQKSKLHNNYQQALNGLFYNYEMKEKDPNIQLFEFKHKATK